MTNWNIYDNFLSAYGDTPKERTVEQAKESFIIKAVKNPCYMENCKRNGEPQRFLAIRTDVAYKYKFVAFPDEEIHVGDMIECNGEHLIISEPPRVFDEITHAAVGRLCNIKLRWQNFDSKIHECYCSLDSGVFSTTIGGIDSVQYPDKQYKLFLPLDEYTEKIFIDKRIAVGTRYDSHGNQILETYRVTGINTKAKSFGNGGHLLILDLRSSEYSFNNDNFDEMICDYIAPEDKTYPDETLLQCSISGRATITAGNKRKYTAKFFNDDNNEINTVTGVWNVNPDLEGINVKNDGNAITISAENNDDLIGEVLTITLSAENYQTAEMKVEVVS